MSANGSLATLVPHTPTPQEQLQARLADPATVDSLNRLLDRVDVITASVEMLDGFLRRGDTIAENVAGSFDEFRGKADSEAMGLIEKLPKFARAGSKMADVADSAAVDRLLSSGLLEKLAEPATLEALTTVLSKLDLISFGVTALDGFLRRGDEIAGSVSDSMGDLKKLASSVDTDKVRTLTEDLPQLVDAGHQLIASGLMGKVSELTEVGMTLSKAGFFDLATVQPLAEMGRNAAESYVAAKSAPQKKYGLFDLLGLLKDPAIQKTLNVAVETSRQFGKKI